jgi:predicted ATPase
VVCTAALAKYLEFPMPQNLADELERVRTHGVFQKRVLLVKNLGFITPTEARRITYEETVRFEQIHERTYRDLGFEVIPIEPGSVLDRVNQIKRVLELDGVGTLNGS